MKGWGTDAQALARAVAEFERVLPGFWWSVGQCSVGAHASCAVDGNGCQKELLEGVKAGEPFDEGFHCDTTRGEPAAALRNVMDQALKFMSAERERRTTAGELGAMLADSSLPEDVRKSALVVVAWLAERTPGLQKSQQG